MKLTLQEHCRRIGLRSAAARTPAQRSEMARAAARTRWAALSEEERRAATARASAARWRNRKGNV